MNKRGPRQALLLMGWAGLLACMGLFWVVSDNVVKEQRAVRIAVASNFREAMEALVKEFESQTGERVVLSYGSTGKLCTQVRNGAPFDALFAADVERPKFLEDEGLALEGSRFTYALGKLALWSVKEGFVGEDVEVLKVGGYERLAMANPRLAPYGVAAQGVLENLGLWKLLEGRLVMGQNVSQVYQFVEKGSVDLGFVAYAQLLHRDEAIKGSYVLVPEELFPPIEQQAVILQDGPVVKAFMDFVKSGEGVEIIGRFGYGLGGR